MRYLFLILIIEALQVLTSTCNAAMQLANYSGQVAIAPYFSAQFGNTTEVSFQNTSVSQPIIVKFAVNDPLNDTSIFSINYFLKAAEQAIIRLEYDPVLDQTAWFNTSNSCTSPEANRLPMSENLIGNDDIGVIPGRLGEGAISFFQMGNLTGSAEEELLSGDCQSLTIRYLGATGVWNNDPGVDVDFPINNIHAEVKIISLDNEILLDYNAIHIKDYYRTGLSTSDIHTDPSQLEPRLLEADFVASEEAIINGNLYDFNDEFLSIAALFMQEEYIQELNVDSSVSNLGPSSDSTIINFPNKKFFTDRTNSPRPPFTQAFDSEGACEPTEIVIEYDVNQTTMINHQMCWSSQIIDWQGNESAISLFGDNLFQQQAQTATATIRFGGDPFQSVDGTEFRGLPIIPVVPPEIIKRNSFE